jgi:hypothetical protein
MTNCKKYQSLIEKHLDGDANDAESADLKAHIQECTACHEEFQKIGLADGIIKDAFTPATSASQAADLTVAKLTALPAGTRRETFSVWRTAAKSRITKLAAAAVIIGGLAIGLDRFGWPIDGAQAAFAQAKKAIRAVPWMHMVITGYQKGQSIELEHWLGNEAQITADKGADGKVHFCDYRKGKVYEYDRDANVITMADTSSKALSEIPTEWDSWEKLFSTNYPGAEMSHSAGEAGGKPVKIYKIAVTEQQAVAEWEIMFDNTTKLPVSGRVRTSEPNGTVLSDAKVVFAYPEQGPATIYDLGAPRSAKAPFAGAEDIADIYGTYRESAPSRYVCVEVSHRGPRNFVDYASIFYMRDGLWREESRSALSIQKEWAEILAGKQASFDSVLELARQGGKRHAWIQLYDSEKLTHIRSKKGGPWKIEFTRSYEFEKSDRHDALVRLGWPRLNLTRPNLVQSNAIERDFSGQEGLVCVELLLQGEQRKGGSFELPARELFYLNPEKDYICQRRELHTDPNAEWQQDSSWREGLDPKEVLLQTRTILDEVIEFGQTDTGQWYPLIIERRIASHRPDTLDFVPLRLNDTTSLWVNTDPEFPEDTFDPANLPKANH